MFQLFFIHTVKARGVQTHLTPTDFYSTDEKREEYCQNTFFCFTQKKEVSKILLYMALSGIVHNLVQNQP